MRLLAKPWDGTMQGTPTSSTTSPRSITEYTVRHGAAKWFERTDIYLDGRNETTQPRFGDVEVRYEAITGYIAQLKESIVSIDTTEEGIDGPTDRALDAYWEFLESALIGSCPLPNAIVYVDGMGGIRTEWRVGNRYLLLVIHARESQKDYVFWQDGEQRKLVSGVSAWQILPYLDWVTQ